MAEIPAEILLLPCSVCSRTFRPEVLERHEKVCEKTTVKKRKIFNSFKARIQGTEIEEFLGPAPLPGQPQKPAKQPPKSASKHNANKPNWKQVHDALLGTLRAARGEKIPQDTATLFSTVGEQCPTCGRHFGERAFDRHVEFCKERTARNARNPVKNDEAHQRLEARVKYRAPSFRSKSRIENFVPKLPSPQPPSPIPQRRQSTPQRKVSQQQNKISPTSTTLPGRFSAPSTATHRRNNSSNQVSPTSQAGNKTANLSSSARSASLAMQLPTLPAVTSSSTPVPHLIRQGSLRVSVRKVSPSKSSTPSMPRRNTSPMKQLASGQKLDFPKLSETKEVHAKPNKVMGQPYSESVNAIMEAANKQMLALLSCTSSTDIAATACSVLARAQLPSPDKVSPPVVQGKSSNMSGDSNASLILNTAPTQTSPRSSSHSPASPLPLTRSPRNSSPLQMSPTSAFTPVFKSTSDHLFDFNKNELVVEGKADWSTCDESIVPVVPLMVTSTPKRNITPKPKDNELHDDHSKTYSFTEDEKNRRNSSVSISSQPSDSTLADEGILWSQLEALHPPLKKSKKKNFARSKSVFEDRNRMLFALTCARKDSSSEEEDRHPPYLNESPYEEDYRKKELRRGSKYLSGALRSDSPLYNEEKGRLSSAISGHVDDNQREGSHSRPRLFAHHGRPQSTSDDVDHQDIINLAVIGGADSAYSSLTRRSPKNSDIASGDERKMSKFCHECGTKFPVTMAKFCVECGVRRLLV